jgi:hypothetical protein
MCGREWPVAELTGKSREHDRRIKRCEKRIVAMLNPDKPDEKGRQPIEVG